MNLRRALLRKLLRQLHLIFPNHRDHRIDVTKAAELIPFPAVSPIKTGSRRRIAFRIAVRISEYRFAVQSLSD